MAPSALRHRGVVPFWSALLLLAGCAGDLESPERFEAPSTSGCPSGVDVVADIFEPKCGNASCHGAGPTPAAALDLISEGWAARLVGSESPEGTECTGRIRLDPADLEGSLLLEKLHDSPSCGNRMPLLVDALSEREIQCVREWAAELVGMGAGADGGV